MLYTQHGTQTNGETIHPATNQEIINYVMSNIDLANAIFCQVQSNNLRKWKEDVYNELNVLHKESYDKDIIDDEVDILYQTGMTISEAANDLDILLNFIKGGNV